MLAGTDWLWCTQQQDHRRCLLASNCKQTGFCARLLKEPKEATPRTQLANDAGYIRKSNASSVCDLQQ